ncbi:MAG UNVERIFIED_CONTAM: hypothetical protein LVT10_14165 [Anaerolineae bacterium]
MLNVDRSNYEQCVVDTLSVATIARNIDSSDVQGTLSGWNAVLRKVGRVRADAPRGHSRKYLNRFTKRGASNH